MTTLPRWLLAALACPRCGGRLASGPGLLRCRRCGPYPVLGGVPVLVPEPVRWCGEYREAALAALAERGLAGPREVAVLRAFAAGPAPEPLRFGDDWTPAEGLGAPPPTPVPGPARPLLHELQALEARGGARAWLLAQLGGRRRAGGLTVELGCGAGALSAALSARGGRLLVADLSLRAVLAARDRAGAGRASVAGVVLEAEALPLAGGAARALVAEHLVDLLDEPLAFLEAARAALAPAGRLLLATPDPGLGTGGVGTLRALARRAGLEVLESADGLPWLRANTPRHLEVYLAQGLVLGPARRRPRR